MHLDELKTFPGHLIRRAQQMITGFFSEELTDDDLTSVQFIALVAIADLEELDATRLAQLIFFDRATIGGVIERLERKRLIVRRQSAFDRRIKVLAATELGRATITRCFPKVAKAQQRFLAPLSEEERRTFLALLARVVGAK